MPNGRALHMLDPMLAGKARHVDSLQSRIGSLMRCSQMPRSFRFNQRTQHSRPGGWRTLAPEFLAGSKPIICSLFASFARICTASRCHMPCSISNVKMNGGRPSWHQQRTESRKSGRGAIRACLLPWLVCGISLQALSRRQSQRPWRVSGSLIAAVP